MKGGYMSITLVEPINKENLFMRDTYVTKIFRNPKNKDFVLRVLRGAFKDDDVFQSDDLELLNIDIGTAARTVRSVSDFVAENDKVIINIEINFSRYYNTYIENKDTSYICQLTLKQIPKGNKKKKYDNVKPIYQLNLNLYDKLGKGEFIYESMMMDTKYHIISNKMLKIVDVNVAYLKKVEYTEIKKLKRNSLEKAIYFMLTNDRNLLDELYEGDNVMKKVLGQIEEYDKDLDSYLIYDKEQFDKDVARENARIAGREEGVIQEKIEIAKEMLKKDLSIDLICEITKLTKKDLESIKNEL